MVVRYLPEAEEERSRLPAAERVALAAAVEKLEVLGEQLGYPHSSAVRSAEEPLRELRPRAGRCRWRAFYRCVADEMVIAAVGPEAQVEPRGFARAVRAAEARLAAHDVEELEADGDE